MPSALEIKLKAKVDSFDAVRERLKPIAKFVGRVQYVDYFFKSGSGSMLSELRIRNFENERKVTVKLLVERSEVQVNSIYSFSVDNPGDFVAFIESLGFHAHSSIIKDCESYLFKGIRVELATVENLGKFVEIVAHISGFDVRQGRHDVEALATQIGLKKEQMDSRYYSLIKDEG